MGHDRAISSPFRAALFAPALATTLALGGCGGVEFQGKVFDYMGLTGDRKEADVKMSERPPLLLPPDTQTLPQPGNGVAVATARADWPKNPEVLEQETVDAQQAAKAKEVTDASDPINPLKGKSNPLLDKWLGKKKIVPADDTPEPDPTDKPFEGDTVAQSKPKPLTPHVPQELPPPQSEDLFHPAPPDSYKNPNAIY